jgi:c-di-GMP-binding flagellar brake protein YcgR
MSPATRITEDAERRRRTTRVRVQAEGQLVGRTQTSVSLLDLSLSGCLTRCTKAVEPGAIFDLRVPLPTFELRAKARVADCSRDGASPEEAPTWLAGIEFLAVSVEQLEQLRLFIAEARPRPPRADPSTR